MTREQQEQPEKPAEKRTKGKQGRASVEVVRVQRWVKIPKKKLTPAMQAKVLERKEKTLEALRLRKAGANYREIGEILHISESYARRLCIKAANDVVIDNAKEVIMMDLLRLDEFQMLATRQLRQNGDLSQIERIMRIMRERRDILGLTTDSWKEQQAERAGSITNNGIMVVQGGSEDFVRSMMEAIGVDPNSDEAQKRLARIRAEEEANKEGEYALQAPRPNELLMAAADSALNVNKGDVIQGEVIPQVQEEDI
jgi:hypothetical protein